MSGSRILVSGAAALVLLAACESPAPPSDPVGERTPTGGPATLTESERRATYASTGPGVVGPSTVTIRFSGQVGAERFRCGASYAGVGTTGSTVTPGDFRFFVSDVALLDEAGRKVPLALVQDGRWQHRDVALIDFEDGTGPCLGGTPGLRDTVTGDVPAGRYRGLVFTLGVPGDLDRGPSTIAAAPLNDPSLAFGPPGGMRFLKVDMATSGQPAGGFVAPPPAGSYTYPAPGYPTPYAAPAYGAPRYGAPAYGQPAYGQPAYGTTTYRYPAAPAYQAVGTGFPVHIGSADCPVYTPGPYAQPQACAYPNRVTIELPSFDPTRDVVVADLKGLLASTNVDANAPGTPPGCQSGPFDPDCTGIFQRLGIAYAGGAPPAQSFFLRAGPYVTSSIAR